MDDNLEPLGVDLILELHALQIELFGGLQGVRDLPGLESALAQPTAEFFGVQRYPDTFAQAGAYLYYIARAHPFADGNKRTALHAALTWLELQGETCPLDDQTLEDLVVEAIEAHWSPEQIAQALRGSPTRP